MAILGYAEAFAQYGAKLKNVQWSVCADGSDACLVVSLWEHHFAPPKGGRVTCSGRFDRWKGPGNSEFRQKVAEAYERQTPVRVVISHTERPDEVDRGADASSLKNTFSVRLDWIGRVCSLDSENYAFEFRRGG